MGERNRNRRYRDALNGVYVMCTPLEMGLTEICTCAGEMSILFKIAEQKS